MLVSCYPGTALKAIREGRHNALAMIEGGVVGAFFYSLVYLIERLRFGNIGKTILPDLLGVNHRCVIVPLVLLFVWILCFIEKKEL